MKSTLLNGCKMLPLEDISSKVSCKKTLNCIDKTLKLI